MANGPASVVHFTLIHKTSAIIPSLGLKISLSEAEITKESEDEGGRKPRQRETEETEWKLRKQKKSASPAVIHI